MVRAGLLIVGTAAGITALSATRVGARAALPTREIVHAGAPTARPAARPAPAHETRTPTRATGARGIEVSALNAVMKTYCQTCHNDRRVAMKNGIAASFDKYAVEGAAQDAQMTEQIIRKLRTQMMPPPTARKPGGDTLVALAETLEDLVEKGNKINPGMRTFQRLNRPEYEAVIRDLLGVEIHAADFLPLDTKSANFDNIADVQSLSPTLLEAYLTAAAAVARMAVGDRSVRSIPVTYRVSPFVSQHPWNHVEGAPFGTRGGIVATHTFPADGWYRLRANIGGGVGTKLEDVDLSVEGERVALLQYERGVERTFASADAPQGADYLWSDRMFIKAGQRKISAAFVRRSDGPYEDLIRPHEWSMASNGNASAGITAPPHVVELSVLGPDSVTGISDDSKSRKIIFSCKPSKTLSERACASQIITRLGTRAYRRPLTPKDREGLMRFYTEGAKQGGFDEGVRLAIQAMLASPHFVFRFERQPATATEGSDYALSDLDLATRLSFFLWGSIPDDRLLSLATAGQLKNRVVMNAEVKRMLADPRSEALATRFAAQWLRLQDLDKVKPDAFWFPDFDQQVADAMVKETKAFFTYIVRNDRPILELFTADYTFVNEALARHYGFPDVAGTNFRKVSYPDSTRRGLFGHGSILVQTSLANRTSPVLRGKWVMEVLLNAPPPPPPPGVPDLEETADSKDGKPLTTRERMELHRKNPTCNACHQYMDPIGLALDNFDVTARWRYRENGMELDTRGRMYDGVAVNAPGDLVKSLMSRPLPLARTFTENLMAYALGRRMEDPDQPTVRRITREAGAAGYKFSALVSGVVNSPAFRTKRADVVADSDAGASPSHSAFAGSSAGPSHNPR
ncbi:MAG: DUF1592 domain-containing protein [Gemmatimonadetes bacterium]|nr:DUF1592 domain-containing protein [Gemmatimonadota bacterium]